MGCGWPWRLGWSSSTGSPGADLRLPRLGQCGRHRRCLSLPELTERTGASEGFTKAFGGFANTANVRDKGGLKDVYEANRYEQGGHLLGGCDGPGRGSSLIDQDARRLSRAWFVGCMDVHSYHGGFDHAAGRH